MELGLNLGVIEEPCLVFGGAYSNLQAAQAVFKAAGKKHIPGHRIICTGDIVAYCGNPQATVDLIRKNNIHTIMGNCEQSLAASSQDCGCGYESGSSCDLLSVKWYQFATAQLDQDTKDWMGNLAESISFEMAGRRLSVVHGSVSSINQFIFPSTKNLVKQRELDLSGVDGIICGHSGIPFSQMIDHRLWHNAGVIGMPANDGTRRVWYSVLTPNGNQIEITHHSLEYDFETAFNSMQRNNLPEEYAQTLLTGIWSSDDIMPEEDSQLRGKKLTAQNLSWHH